MRLLLGVAQSHTFLKAMFMLVVGFYNGFNMWGGAI